MSRREMRFTLLIALLVGSGPAGAQDSYPAMPLPGGPFFQGRGGPEIPDPARLPPPNIPVGPPASSARGAAIGQQFQYQNWPAAAGAASIGPGTAAPVLAERLVESTWYTRVDYSHWNERSNGADFVNEDGALVTLGYVRRIAAERFRAELFGGNMHYAGCGQFFDDAGQLWSEPLSSRTGYLGVRGEYDLLLEPESWPAVSFVAGIGTRFWVRDLKDGITDFGTPVTGYQETWWTIYPYLGIERRRVLRDGAEFYGAGRIGFTAVTYQHVSLGDVALYPKPGIMGQLEGGLRGRSLFLAAFFEAMTWGESAVVRDTLQPASRLFTVGLKTGFSF